MAVIEVFFDFQALHEIQLTIDVSVNQVTRFLTTQC